MSEHFEDYFYMYLFIACLLIVAFAFGMMSEAGNLRQEAIDLLTLKKVENESLVIEPLIYPENEPIITIPIEIEEEPETYEQDQIIKLQEDNLWCFGEKNRLESQIKDLEVLVSYEVSEKEKCTTSLNVILNTMICTPYE